MEEVIDLAQKLGAAISRHKRYCDWQDIQQKVSADAEAVKLLEDLAAQARKIQELESETKPVEVSDKKELERLRQAIANHPLLKELARAQVDYAELMRNVNKAIQGEIGSVS